MVGERERGVTSAGTWGVYLLHAQGALTYCQAAPFLKMARTYVHAKSEENAADVRNAQHIWLQGPHFCRHDAYILTCWTGRLQHLDPANMYWWVRCRRAEVRAHTCTVCGVGRAPACAYRACTCPMTAGIVSKACLGPCCRSPVAWLCQGERVQHPHPPTPRLCLPSPAHLGRAAVGPLLLTTKHAPEAVEAQNLQGGGRHEAGPPAAHHATAYN